MQTMTMATDGQNGLEEILVERRTSRRGFLRGAGKLMVAGAASAVALPAVSALTGGQPAGAQQLSGVDLMRAWASNQLPVQWFPELNWSSFIHSSGATGFYYPPDWSADEIAEPTPSDYNDGTLIAAQVTAPDGSATLMIGAQFTYNPVDARDAAFGQLAHMVGEGEATLLAEDFAEMGNMAGSFLAAEIDGVLITIHFIATEMQGGNSLAFTVATGAAEAFDWAVQAAFLPILGQFVAKGGGGNGGGGGGGGSSDDDDDDNGSWGSGEPGDIINPDWERESEGNDPGDVINPQDDYDYTGDDDDDY